MVLMKNAVKPLGTGPYGERLIYKAFTDFRDEKTACLR